MPDDIVLIGPVRAGKSTVGQLLAERLHVPQVSLDALREGYYREIGFDPDLARAYRASGGFLALYLYRSQFDAYTVERMLAEHQRCVFDFGAGIYESLESFRRVQRVLAPYPNVVLLLPSADIETTIRVLRERDSNPPSDITFDLLRHFLTHHTYYDLAKMTVYNQGKTPQETCEEIFQLTRR